MSAKFRSVKSFRTPSRHYFCISGEIIEGEINIVDQFYLPWNSQFGMTGDIYAIDLLDSADKSLLTICINYEPDEELIFWISMNIGVDDLFEIGKRYL